MEHAWADMTATVEAGCTVANLQRTLAQHGQRLAIDPLWPDRATIGGILATNDSGALRLRFGSLRDLIIGITVALPDGTLATSGGKVVKNVAGYDLPKLMTGALGTLGVINIFRLHPPRALDTHRPHALLEAAQSAMLAIQDSQLAHCARFALRPWTSISFSKAPAALRATRPRARSLLSESTRSLVRARASLARRDHQVQRPPIKSRMPSPPSAPKPP
jgi:FAD/FMN-containing dehydrogenase